MNTEKCFEAGRAAVLIDAEVVREGYVQRVLTENQIPGLCRLRIRNTDGERRYCFQTGGAVSLEEKLSQEPPERETLQRILEALADLQDILTEYLLDLDCLLLEPDLVFFDIDGNIRFCACPGTEVPFDSRLERLADGFGCREELCASLVLDPDTGEPDLRKLAASLVWDPPLSELPGWVEEEQRTEDRKSRSVRRKKDLSRIGSILMPLIGLGVELLLYFSGLLSAFSGWVQIGVYGSAAVFFLMMTMILREAEDRIRMSTSQALEQLAAPEEEPLPEILIDDTIEVDAEELESAADGFERGETVLLSELAAAEKAFAILITRQPDRYENLYVTKTPFRIGKDETADAELHSSYLSREHAVIEAEDGVCRIRDEGSTNGTWLNGDRLLAGTWTGLSNGDEIRFADVCFRYCPGGALAAEDHNLKEKYDNA